MCSVPIDGIEVSFPFNPYPVQVEYMRAVISALNSGSNALLESPTGTGKTLCLLCATLAWLEKRRSNEQMTPMNERAGMTRVLYCSHTHAQLSQVIRELKRTRYGGVFSMSILGSREHMCVNPQVLNLRNAHAQQSMCNTLREEKNCRYYRGFQLYSSRSVMEANEPGAHDMEDFVSNGRSCGCCPYYMAREQAKEADITFLPYNYIFDLSLRKQLPFEVKKSILIVDEAHNLPSILASSSCMNLSPLDLTSAIHDCSRALAMQRLMMESSSCDNPQEGLMAEQEISSLKIILHGLETCIIEEEKGEIEKRTKTTNNVVVSSAEEIIREGSYMTSFLTKALITRKLFTGSCQEGGGINDVMTKSISLLAQCEGAATGLAKVQQFLNFVFEHHEEGDEEACRFVIQSVRSADGRQTQRSLGYWCLDTSRMVQKLVSGLRSLLLTSGTLSPLDHFAAELGLCFDLCLKGNHVIQPHQVMGSVLCKGPGGEKLNGSYVFRERVDYKLGLGMCLVNLTRHTPGGVLVFFPSYAALGAAVGVWRAGREDAREEKEANEREMEGEGELTVWGQLAALKPVFVEPVAAADLPAIVAAFQRAVDAAPARGAILLAVCRGKISEGVDFADHHGRCVVVAGIPFANHTDLFVRLKRDYITRVAPQRPKVQGKLFTGDDWYVNEAMRAVNQCMGRVIRHKDDYGVVLLADERFANQLGRLSKWVADRCSVHREFREAYACVAKFFLFFRRRMGDGLLRSSASTTPSIPATTISGSTRLAGMSVTPNAEEIPDSAEKAKRFAAEEMNRVTAEKIGRVQKCIADATEVPSLVFHDSYPVGKVISVPALPLSPSTSAGTRTEAGAQMSLFKKQVLPVLPALPESEERTEIKTLIGSTSKEFCQFMKKKLQPASYDKFRDKLKQIASIRDTPTLSVDEKKSQLDSAVDELTVLFREAAAEHEKELLLAFAQHIPAEFRPYFTHLLQKRRRTA